jgi:hypothetical protein
VVLGLLVAALIVALGLVLAEQSLDRRAERATRLSIALATVGGNLAVERASFDGQQETLARTRRVLARATSARDRQQAAVDVVQGRLDGTRRRLRNTRDTVEQSAREVTRTRRCLVRASQLLNQVAVNDTFGLSGTFPSFLTACRRTLGP